METTITIRKDIMGNVIFTDSRFPQREGFIQQEQDINQFFGDIGLPADEQDHISRGYTYEGKSVALDTLETYLDTETLDSFSPLCPICKGRLKKEHTAGENKYHCWPCNQSFVVINPSDYSDSFWKHNYAITIGVTGPVYLVNQNCEGDALDELIDWIEINAPGYLFTDKEIDALRKEKGEENDMNYICGGNHCRYLKDGIQWVK